jgi:hypothetical protein
MTRPLRVAGALLLAALSSGSAGAYRNGDLGHDPLPAEVLGRSRGVLPAFEESSEYPYDSSPGYSHKLQGVAHDSSHWYMTAFRASSVATTTSETSTTTTAVSTCHSKARLRRSASSTRT